MSMGNTKVTFVFSTPVATTTDAPDAWGVYDGDIGNNPLTVAVVAGQIELTVATPVVDPTTWDFNPAIASVEFTNATTWEGPYAGPLT